MASGVLKIAGLTLLVEAEAGGYVVRVPELGDLVTEGDSLDEVVANAREAISGYLKGMRDVGLPVSLPPQRVRAILHELAP